MPSFEERFYLEDPTLLQRLRRNIALIADSLVFVWIWATAGRQIRRRYRKAKAEDKVLLVDGDKGLSE